MKLSLLLLATFVYLSPSLTTAADVKIYRWVDEDGKTHFSDTAIQGTQEVEVKSNNLLAEEDAQPPTSNSADPFAVTEEKSSETKTKAIIKYQATILSPEDDKALRSNDGSINIHVSVEPEKENSQTLQLYLDGKKLGSPQMSSTIRALNIDRGTHQVQVKLLDEDGKQLAKTQIVTVHLLRASVN